MQRNNSPILLATIALGLLAILGAAFYFLSGSSSGPAQPVAAVPTPTPAPIDRWVAARNIPPRTILTSDMLRKAALTGPAPADAITKLEDVRGQITKEPIPAGQTVTLSSFTPSLGRVVPASFSIPSGLRAVAIFVDPDSTAAGLVDVGDRVDVIATHRLHQQKEGDTRVVGAVDFTAGRLIASNLLVLGVDKSLNAPKPTPTPAPGVNPAGAVAGGPPPQPTPPPPPPQPGQVVKTRVLLAASPDIATSLVASQDQGTLNVIIRNPMDADSNTSGVPEKREYPSYLVRVPPSQSNGGNGGGSSGGGSSRSVPLPDFPPMTTTTPPVTSPMPVKPETLPDAAPTGSDAGSMAGSAEVTVIRGTEKTRVIVPQR